MDPQTTLATIAEVGIAIAGFGGVIAAIASVTPRGFSKVARTVFRALLTGCIMLVAFALLPQVLSAAALGETQECTQRI